MAAQAGRHAEAGSLWEQACDFARAAEQFLTAGQPHEAILRAVLSGHAEGTDACLDALELAPDLAKGVTARLQARGFSHIAARLEERLGNLDGAAALYLDAGFFFEASRALARAGRLDRAIEALEQALEDPGAPSKGRLALAMLQERRGRLIPAAAALQRIGPNDPWSRASAPRLARLLTQLRLPGAARLVLDRQNRAGHDNDYNLDELAAFDAPATPVASSDSREILFGRYEVLELVASTATARVYHAVDRSSQTSVAIKVLSPSLVSGTGRDAFFRFEREVRILRELEHPSIVPLLEYHPEGPALALKWMGGGSLRTRLEAGQVSPRLGALAVAKTLLALSEAHRRGILHRDIKPENILFDEHGAPYLADFGTAHVADHAQTITQGVIGTLAYMAPPQRHGQPATVRSDLYSVGAVFWHVLTGAPPGTGAYRFAPGLSLPQRQLAERLVDVDALPETAAEMLALIEGEVWPATIESTPPPSERRDQPQAASSRLSGHPPEMFDALLGRPVRVLTAGAELRARAQSFAAADHPGLASVLLYDPEKEQIWLESMTGDESRRLTHEHKESLKTALTRLHQAGGSHGAVDDDHLRWRGTQPVLAFPMTTERTSLDEDLAKLERLR